MVLIPDAAAIGRISGAARQSWVPRRPSQRPAQTRAGAALRLAAAAIALYERAE
jgi:hypothetical protein